MVYYNFNTSKGSILTLGFSTDKALERFSVNILAEIKDTNERIMKLYKGMFTIDLDVLAVIRYYMKVERRMFHIEYEGVTYKCLNEVQFHLNSLTKLTN